MRHIKKSTLFWNGVIIVFQVVLGIISFDALFYLQIGLSGLSTFLIAFNFLTEDETTLDMFKYNIPLFLWITPPSICILSLYYIIHSIVNIISWIIDIVLWIINNPIEKFNDWLDTEKEKRMKFSEYKDKLKNQ